MRVQAVLLVAAAVLGLLWIVALGDDEGALQDGVGVVADGNATAEAPIGADARVDGPDLAPGRPGASVPDRPGRAPGAGRSARDPEREMPTRRIEGRVVDARGARVEGAVVYLLGKQIPKGKDGTDVARSTDAEGRFALTVRALAGAWLCAMKHGHASAFLDGATLDADGFIRIVLPDPLELTVLVVDAEGKPVANEPVQVLPTRHRGPPLRFPGPEASEQERFEFTGEDGSVTFHFDHEVPVLVSPKPEGVSVAPRDVYLAVPEGRIEFVTAPGVRLRVRPGGGTGAPSISKGVWLTIHDEDGTVVAHDAAAPVDGAYETLLPLAPGRYVLQFSTNHLEPQVVPLVVARGGETVEVEVESLPLRRSATLELPEPIDQMIAFGRRLDGEHARLGWQRANASGRPPSFTLRPGDHELVVLDPKRDRVAVVRAALRPGDDEKAVLRWRSGVQVSLADVLPEDVAVRSLRVHAAGYGWLPVAGRRGSKRARLPSEEAVLQVLGTAGPDGLVLGPYPGTRVTLHVTDWEGREYVETAR